MQKSLRPLDEVLKSLGVAAHPPSTQPAKQQTLSAAPSASIASYATSLDKCLPTMPAAATSTSTLDDGEKSDASGTQSILADADEARSVKYAIARIVRLSDGRYALFSPFVNRNDVDDLLGIGTLEELAPLIPDVQQVEAYRPQTAQKAVRPLPTTLDLEF